VAVVQIHIFDGKGI